MRVVITCVLRIVSPAAIGWLLCDRRKQPFLSEMTAFLQNFVSSLEMVRIEDTRYTFFFCVTSNLPMPSITFTTSHVTLMGVHRIVFQGWAIRGSEKRKSQRGPGAEPQWGSKGESPRSWRRFLKIMHKYFVYWDFRQHLQHKKHLTTFPWGQVPPLAHACGRPW